MRMYLPNFIKLQLGLEGYTNPSQAELEAAVTKTGYKGFVSLDYEAQKPREAPRTTTR